MMLKVVSTAAIATAGMLALATPAQAQSYPHVRDHARGTSVTMARDCQVEFNRRGQRVDASRACDGRELRYAAQVMQEHRRYAGDRYRDQDRYDRHDRYDRDDRHDDHRYGRDGRYDRDDRYDRDGRYDRNDRYTRHDNRYRSGRTIAPARVVGERDSRAYDMLAHGGWRQISHYSRDRKSMESLWYNSQGNRCVSVYSKKGKVRAVMPAPRQRCVVRY